MTTNNILQNVITYQKSSLAALQNNNCFINTANMKFKNFDKQHPANRGDTVSFDLPTRFISSSSLTATFQGVEQRAHSLTVDKAASVSYDYTTQQFMFNVRGYMDNAGRGAAGELGARIEEDVANATLKTYRHYGDGTTAIDTFTKLATAIAQFDNYGAAKHDRVGYLYDLAVPAIIGSGLNQFALDRNNRLANSWELGDFNNTRWVKSNHLPIHTAGSVGIAQTTLTFKSINAAGDTIVFSGAATSDAAAVKENDIFEFLQTDLFFLTFVGHTVSGNKVQFRATADAASDPGGDVSITIDPPLLSALGRNQNLNRALTTSDTVKAKPSHRAGMICSGGALFMAMPQLPDQTPYPTANAVDEKTGCSMRMYYGSSFGTPERGFIHDVIWGYTLVPEYAMRLVFPI